MKYRSMILGVVSLSAAVLLAGCGAGSSGDTVAIRLVDAVFSPVGTDFSVGGSSFVADVTFTGVTTYGYVSNGNNDFVGYATGTSNVVIPTQTLNLVDAVDTVGVAGIPGDSNPALQPMFYVFPDNNSIPAQGQIRVRVINLSPDAGPVDVFMGSQIVGTNVAYPVVPVAPTPAPYASINPLTSITPAPPGGTASLTLTAKTTGTSTVLTTKIVPVPDPAQLVGHVFTFFVEGQVSLGTLTIVAQEDT